MNKLTAVILTCIIFLAYHSKAALPDIITDPNTRDTVEYLDSKVKKLTDNTTFNSAIENPGYTYLPNGLLMQWGYYSAGANSPTITFPIPYTSLIIINATPVNNANGSMIELQSISNTSFVPNQRRHDAVALTCSLYWIAIGK